MADQPTPDAVAAPQGEGQPAPQIAIESQYIKDLSFENPQGPNAQNAVAAHPEVAIEVNTSVRPLGEKDGVGRFEVTLLIKGEARLNGQPVFIIELTYAGALALANVPQEAVAPVLLIEGPRLLFPFARNIIAEVTRDGGFPPLFIQPIDFVQLYRDQHMKGQAQPRPGGNAGATG
jgi:preprotein translocase subunit SecB